MPRKIPFEIHAIWPQDVPGYFPHENKPDSREMYQCPIHQWCSMCLWQVRKENESNILNLMQTASNNSLIFNSKIVKYYAPKITFYSTTFNKDGMKPYPEKTPRNLRNIPPLRCTANASQCCPLSTCWCTKDGLQHTNTQNSAKIII